MEKSYKKVKYYMLTWFLPALNVAYDIVDWLHLYVVVDNKPNFAERLH